MKIEKRCENGLLKLQVEGEEKVKIKNEKVKMQKVLRLKANGYVLFLLANGYSM
jgi:hypothetical protein